MSINDEFIAFNTNNPEVWVMFRDFTFQLISAGRKRFGAKAIFERIRWEKILTTSDKDFKINNNYCAYYARMFMNIYPEYLKFFRVRGSEADQLWPELAKKLFPAPALENNVK